MKTFFIKLYLFIIWKWIFFIRNLYYTINSIKKIKIRKWIWHRDKSSYDWSQSFIKYITDINSKEKFLKWFDEKNKKLWKQILEKIEKIAFNNILGSDDVITKDDNKEQKKFSKKYFKYIKEKTFPLYEVWSYLNLYYVPKLLDIIPNIENILNDKDIIDAWAYIWDSSIAFSKTFKKLNKIYAFEPVIDNFSKLNTCVKSNNIKNIIPVQKWVWKTNETVKITSDGAMSIIWDNWNEKIEIVSIDSFVHENKIKPWLIKWDIEWFEYDSILWTEGTIKKFKPILLISIYHNWKDFFEIKELINSWNLWYKFKLTRWNYFHPYSDILLVCY